MPAYKDEKRNTWYVKFQYRTWNGESATKLKRGFKTKKEALVYERDFLALNSNTSLTMVSLCQSFLQDRKQRVKLQTYVHYSKTVSSWIAPYFEGKIASEVTPAMVRSWQTELLNKGISPNSVRQFHSVLSTVYNYGIKFCGLTENPVRLAGSPGKVHRKEISFWTPDQFDTFIETITDDKWRFLYQTLYFSGMRIGECLALKWNDVNWITNELRVDETYHRMQGKIYITPPKTDKSKRHITMPVFYMNLLKEYQTHCYDTSDDARIFFWTSTVNHIRERMRNAISRTDLPQITTHDLRHSHASLMIDMGMPVTMIADRLGHEDPSITLQVYAHMFPSRQKDVADRLDKMYHNRIT